MDCFARLAMTAERRECPIFPDNAVYALMCPHLIA
jgi:hypothetical protein